MALPVANGSFTVVGSDTHVVLVPTSGGPVPVPLPHAFAGRLRASLCPSVKIGGQPAATEGSVAQNQPAHIPTAPGTAFQRPPANRGSVAMGSPTVKIGGRACARSGDPVNTCNDPADAPVGRIVGAGTVRAG
jgi:uncharacterized Zn-binding protein involved in type VI secretion